jgi:hypothetical protein
MEDIEVKLTKDEALVLFELLARYSDTDQLTVQDRAEERALWNLNCLLEKILAEPFSPNWLSILESARSRLRD